MMMNLAKRWGVEVNSLYMTQNNNKQKILHTINIIYFLFILGQQIDTNIIFNPLILLQRIY